MLGSGASSHSQASYHYGHTVCADDHVDALIAEVLNAMEERRQDWDAESLDNDALFKLSHAGGAVGNMEHWAPCTCVA